MTDLAVIGCGYVGLVSAACFAELGHRVTCVDIDERRVDLLRSGRSPVHEPGLEELIQRGMRAGRLSFHSTYPDLIDADIVFIAVNTPGAHEGAADLGAVRGAVSATVSRIRPGTILVNKSTVPIGTGELVNGIAQHLAHYDHPVVSNPEFLREGSAVVDFRHPDRVVLGSSSEDALEAVAALYRPLGAPIQLVDIRTAEMIKYASNAFLATKISFINEIAEICEALGADVLEVARGMGLDPRIGGQYLQPGLGWGGSCFPKDVRALTHMAAVHGAHPQLLRSVIDINKDQRLRVVKKVRAALGHLEGQRILVLGAAFKGSTDDLRDSPALDLATLFHLEGALVTIYDPLVPAARIEAVAPFAVVAGGPVAGSQDAHAIVVATDCPPFRDLPLEEMRRVSAGDLLMDGRNVVDPVAARAAGFTYRCIGRPMVEGPAEQPARATSVAAGVS